MKLLILSLFITILTSCSSSVIVKDCENVQDNVYRCEEIS